jgi:uncharacterized protein
MGLWTAWMLGLVGSLHCAGMCGPLALALPVTPAGGAAYVVGRVVYNLGRVLTYGMMGLVFGLLGKTVAVAGLQQWVSLGLGLVLLSGLVLGPRVALTGAVSKWVGGLKRRMGAQLRTRTLRALAVLGLLNGLLPCGLVYVACAAAATRGEVLAGVSYMVVFGLGTVPMMLGISLSGRLVQAGLRRVLSRAVPVTMALVAVLLVVRGLGLGIPYLSPDLSGAGRGACCHEGMGVEGESGGAAESERERTP